MLYETFLGPPSDAVCRASFGLRQEYMPSLIVGLCRLILLLALCRVQAGCTTDTE